jgi:hypothetical protein
MFLKVPGYTKDKSGQSTGNLPKASAAAPVAKAASVAKT